MPKDTTKLFTCKVCNKIFERSGDLGRHSRTHNGDRPHICTWPGCEKAFSQSSGLKTHMNTHTKSQPHACGEEGCDARFNDPSSRSRHYREVHKNQGTYACPFDECRSTIKRRSAFTHHLHEKHPNAHLSVAQIDACNPMLRGGFASSSTGQITIKVDSTGRKSSRAKASRLQSQKSSSPVFFCRTGGESPTNLEPTSTLAIPAIPDLIHSSTSSTPAPYGFDSGSPAGSSDQSSSPSSIYNYYTQPNDYRQRQQVHYVPRTPTPPTQFVHPHQRLECNRYLTVPHASHSLYTHSAMGSPAPSYAETSIGSSPSSSPSPAPEIMRLYPTVRHATPEPESQPHTIWEDNVGMHVGNDQAEGIKHDIEMEMFLSSLHTRTNNYGMDLAKPDSYQWGIGTGFGVDHGITVVG